MEYRRCRISSLAVAKMCRHAANAGTTEVMGMLVGLAKDGTFDVADCFALPVQATETRVNAMAEAYEYIVQYIGANRLTGSVVGWYHSHPGYGCFLSRIDIETQAQNQRFQDPFVAIVLDPLNTVRDRRVDIGAFRTAVGNDPEFYPLEVEYYRNPHDMALLTMLDNKTWAHTLSESSS